jgi:hypothetical protein
MGLMSGAHSGQSMSLTLAGSIAVLEIYRNHESRSGLVGTGLLCRCKAVLQQASLHILKNVLVPCYMMKHFSLFIGDQAPTVDK